MQMTQRQFLFLEDVLAGEQLGILQFQDLAQHCTDPQLKHMCQQLASQNMQHFNRFIGILNQAQGGDTKYNADSTQTTQWGGFSGNQFPQ